MDGGVGGGVYSHFRIQPNYSVEIVLCYCLGCDNFDLTFLAAAVLWI